MTKTTARQIMKYMKPKVCRDCMFKQASMGSSRCEDCSITYRKNKKKSDVRK